MKKMLIISAVLVLATAAYCQTANTQDANAAKKVSARPCVPNPKEGKVCPEPPPCNSAANNRKEYNAQGLAISAFGDGECVNYVNAKDEVIKAHSAEFKDTINAFYEQDKKAGLVDSTRIDTHQAERILAAQQSLLKKYSPELTADWASLRKDDEAKADSIAAGVKAKGNSVAKEEKQGKQGFFSKIFQALTDYVASSPGDPEKARKWERSGIGY
ncbi:MAG: hypothetical protein FWF35_05395 [Elusimicrobia bacterium]|nr:hypothetical protein [Elusimicrobiota bacterium]